jgi:hypothetical protein
MIVLFKKILYSKNDLRQSSSRNTYIAARHEFVDVSSFVSTSDKEYITKAENNERKTLERASNTKKCVECVTRSHRRFFDENIQK